MDEWMDELMNGCDTWVDEWMDRVIDGGIQCESGVRMPLGCFVHTAGGSLYKGSK